MATFSLRSLFPVFAVVGLSVTALKQSDATWGAISLLATIFALVWLAIQAIDKDNTLAFGCIVGFLAYVCLAMSAFSTFNPVSSYLALSQGINWIGIHIWHLVVGWFCGLLAAPCALLVRKTITPGRRQAQLWQGLSLLCCLGLAELQIFGWPGGVGRPGWWNGAFALVTLMATAVVAATTAVYRKDAFGAGYLIGLVAYLALGMHFFSVLNPFSQKVVAELGDQFIALPLAAAWATSVMCGSLAFLVHRLAGYNQPL